MSSFLSKVKQKILLLSGKGFFEIFISTALNKLLTLVATFVLVRIMSKTDYGIYTYAFNIASIVLIFSSIGLDSAVLQFSAEKKEREDRLPIYKFCFGLGCAVNLLISILFFLYAMFLPITMEEGRKALIMLSFYNCFQFVFKTFSAFFRVELKNKKYAILNVVNSVCYVLLACIGSYYLAYRGTILGKYLALFITLILGFALVFKEVAAIKKAPPLKWDEKKAIIKYGLAVVLTNCISEVLYYIDIVVIGIIINQATSIAEYKIATTIPFALNSIPLIIVTFIYPYFARNKDNYSWIRDNYRKVMFACLLMNLVITILGVAFADFIITTLYGSDYSESITCFRILMVGFFFSGTFRTISGNVIAMMRKVKINLIVDAITSSFNVVADVLLVLYFGSVGAATSSLLVVILSGLLSTLYLELYLRKKIKSPGLEES